jgi:hypothetical protein
MATVGDKCSIICIAVGITLTGETEIIGDKRVPKSVETVYFSPSTAAFHCVSSVRKLCDSFHVGAVGSRLYNCGLYGMNNMVTGSLQLTSLCFEINKHDCFSFCQSKHNSFHTRCLFSVQHVSATYACHHQVEVTG